MSMSSSQLKGFIFDIDGTICDRDSTKLYPQFVSWLKMRREYGVALATNQGGVGCRLMLGDETADSIGLPTEAQVAARLEAIRENIRKVIGRKIVIKSCFAFQDKQGMWSPTPPRISTAIEKYSGQVWTALDEFKGLSPSQRMHNMAQYTKIIQSAEADLVKVLGRNDEVTALTQKWTGWLANAMRGLELG